MNSQHGLQMNRKTLLEISRSEMPKSVLLGYLLQKPGFLARLRQNGVWGERWLMRPVTGGDACELDLPLDSANVMAAANFHVRRDLGAAELSFVEQYGGGTPKNEIDVVAVIEDTIAIGFELKWKSRIGPIGAQLSQERECLALLAQYYGCRFSSMVAVLPAARQVSEADAVVTLAGIHKIIGEFVHETSDPLMKLAEQEFAATKPNEPWEFVADVESLLARSDVSSGDECVGYEKGLPHLKGCSISEIKKRPSWKISKRAPDRSWFRLDEVAGVIRQKLSQTPES